MPNLTSNEFDKIMTEYVAANKPLTGEQLYKEIDVQIYDGKPFDCLPAKDQFFFNLAAETSEEVYAEHREQNQ